MTWHYNKKILYTYVWYGTQYAYAYVDGLGWRRIKTGAADGVTNLNVLLTAAQANGKLAHVSIEDATGLIDTAMLV